MDDATLALLLVKVTALLVAGAAVAATLSRATAGTRHLVWLTTLVGLLVLPLASRHAPLQLQVFPRSLGLVRPEE